MGKRNKYRNYSLEDIANAIHLVKNQTLSIRAASRRFNVPKSTVIDKLCEKSSIESQSGPKPVLSKSEENRLAEWLINMAKIGYGLTRKQLLLTVKRILDNDGRQTPFKDNLPGKDWFHAFIRRNPQISSRTPQKLGKERAVITWQKIVWWFEDFAKYLTESSPEGVDILKDPSRIYNADESGFPQDPKSGRILAPKGFKNVYSTSSSDKSQVTVLACMSATAHYLPPMLVFPGERFRGYNPLEGFTEAVLGRTKSGWMDAELFYTWVRDHFIPAISERKVKRPVILLVDGHTSHISLEVSQLCNSENIILYCFLAHASHIIQPCDVSLFGPLKKHWRDSVRDFQCQNPGEFVTKTNVASVFKAAWLKGTTVDVAVKGFMHAGLFPFSVERVDKNKVEPSNVFSVEKPISLSLTEIPNSDTAHEATDDFDVVNNVPEIEVLEADEAEIASVPDISTPQQEIATNNEGIPACLYPDVLIVNPPESNTCDNKQKQVSGNASSFDLLVTPCQKPAVVKRKARIPLPKPVSGIEMIQILEDRRQQKESEAVLKEKRKIERETKRKLKEAEKCRKDEQRKEKRQKREKNKESKNEENQNNQCVCFKCKLSGNDVFVCCEICSAFYHAKCSGVDFTDVHPDDIVNFPFECDQCL